MSTAPPAEVDYVALDGSPQFRELRRAKRGFCIPLAIVGGLWFVGYAVGAMFAPSSTPRPSPGASTSASCSASGSSSRPSSSPRDISRS